MFPAFFHPSDLQTFIIACMSYTTWSNEKVAVCMMPHCMLHCSVLHDTAWWHVTLLFSTLHDDMLHCSVLHTLHDDTPHCSVLHGTIALTPCSLREASLSSKVIMLAYQTSRAFCCCDNQSHYTSMLLSSIVLTSCSLSSKAGTSCVPSSLLL